MKKFLPALALSVASCTAAAPTEYAVYYPTDAGLSDVPEVGDAGPYDADVEPQDANAECASYADCPVPVPLSPCMFPACVGGSCGVEISAEDSPCFVNNSFGACTEGVCVLVDAYP